MIFDKHSSFTDLTQRSAYAFKFGLRAGRASVLTPVPTQNSESQRNPRVSPAFRVLSRDRLSRRLPRTENVLDFLKANGCRPASISSVTLSHRPIKKSKLWLSTTSRS